MRSKWEVFIRDEFQRNGVNFKYEPHGIEYLTKATYTPDFLLDKDIYLEVKGWFRPEDRKKMLEVKASNPDLDIRLWFQSNSYLSSLTANQKRKKKAGEKLKKKRYSDWAEKHGFKYHIGKELPHEWIQDSTE